ncbi:MAG: HU family DNA-binding protein [Paludibacteraceae bacterium]|nr:HU family DNA-binding protein [Paludibacteraceae bacterium]
MNKSDLTAAIAANSGLSKIDAKKALDAFVKVVSYQLKRGEKISITGFGSFQTVQRKARTGVNPATHDKMEIAAKKSVKFKAGAELADKIQ